MKKGDIIYCPDKLSNDPNRAYVCLDIRKDYICALPITKQKGIWDYQKLPVAFGDIKNFKSYPSYVVLNIFEFGCLECESSRFNSNITEQLKQKLKSYGFDI